MFKELNKGWVLEQPGGPLLPQGESESEKGLRQNACKKLYETEKTTCLDEKTIFGIWKVGMEMGKSMEGKRRSKEHKSIGESRGKS